jgi:ATP-dependent Clp protease protease subunit
MPVDNFDIPSPRARKLYLAAQVNQKSMNDLTKAIIGINEHDRLLEKLYPAYNVEYTPPPIEIYIDSYGGAVYQCFGLLGVMEKSVTPVHTIATGAAMSCGFMILISGHKRFGYRHSTPLYHQVSTGFWGKVKDMEENLEQTKKLQKKIEEITLERTNISKKKLKEILKNKVDWYMTAEEALALGVIDGIL